ncbi:MAG: hypothetical protein IE885_00385 [Campylobacterales bacterium]|nr:hypothetical protein [Campylobacterales bacterium]
MNLPAITLPQINLPFEIPLLMHPPVVHFAIALPIIILMLELVNLVLKRRSISVMSFLLFSLAVVVAVIAYFTGLTDGREAFDALSDEGQEALKAHKNLGTYLMLVSGIVWFFKVLSMLIDRGLMKILYMLVLILFVAGVFEQGEEGGKLVYIHGANNQKVKALDDEMFDMNEEMDDLKEELKDFKEPKQESAPKPQEQPQTPAPATPEANTTTPVAQAQ